MGKLVCVIGNSGVGKTTLVKALCTVAPFKTGLEKHVERPFQARFKQDPSFALHNQVDYLLLRAEQEKILRRSSHTGLLDGGLDQDFHIFTRLFHYRGYLDDDDFSLCERFYRFTRSVLPQPELYIYLDAPLDIIRRRFMIRQRDLEIAAQDDLDQIDSLLHEWLSSISSENLLRLDASPDDPTYQQAIPLILNKIRSSIS